MSASTTATLLDSITKPGDTASKVVLSGSHGGQYAAYLAARSRARAIILHDAGIGLDDAGIACINYCQQLGMASACVDHMSARIGDATDMLRRGRISRVNDIATQCGVRCGMSVKDAVDALQQAPLWQGDPPAYKEGESEVELIPGRTGIACLDSASMVRAEHTGRIVATGSHGALVGGNPANALRADADVALFNDAGIGIDEVGVTRLPALDQRGIAAATVAANSARIGEGRSTLLDGRLSAINHCAQARGAKVDMPARDWAKQLLAGAS